MKIELFIIKEICDFQNPVASHVFSVHRAYGARGRLSWVLPRRSSSLTFDSHQYYCLVGSDAS